MVQKAPMPADDALSSWRALRRSLELVVRLAPTQIIQSVLLNVVLGAGPALTLYIGMLVIDRVSTDATHGGGSSWWNDQILLYAVVAFLVSNILLDAIQTLQGFVFATLKDKLTGGLQERIFGKLAEFPDISLYEDPSLLDTLRLATDSIPRVQNLANLITNLLTGIFSFVPAVALTVGLAWWVPVLIFLATAPSVWVQLHYEDKAWSVNQAQAGLVRRMTLHEQMLTRGDYAKEVRQFHLQDYFLGEWRKMFQTAFDEVRRTRRRGSGAILFWSAVSGLGSGIPYVYLVFRAFSGDVSLGSLAMFAGLIFEVRRTLFILIGNVANISGVAMASVAVFKLLNAKPRLLLSGSTGDGVEPHAQPALASHPSPSIDTVGLHGVTFRYPGEDQPALRDINLTVRRGEMVVVVGENGAGKTTLAKLLTRLYDPNEGYVTFSGRDLREWNVDALRDRVAVVNQDFARFPATLADNIGYGRLAGLADRQAILSVARSVGLAGVLARLPAGMDTPLSRELEGGTDLSGGQWQRIALARAYFRHTTCDLLLLDEPTSALDPRTEEDIFALFLQMARGRAAVVISHRLSLARLATRVVVLDHGQIMESGTHEELMERRGIYHTMFTRQASRYVDEVAPDQQ